MAVAAGLKATDNAAEVFLHRLSDEENAMQVVRHHLQRLDFHLRVITRNAPPFITHPLSQRRQLYPWRFGVALRGSAMANHSTKERTSALGYHRHHIHHALRVVVTNTAALHGGFLLACKCLLTLVNLALHYDGKIT